jgi:hypothetical protein
VHIPSTYGKIDELGDVTICPYKLSTNLAVETCGLNNECIMNKCSVDGYKSKLTPYQICRGHAKINASKNSNFGYNDCDAMLNSDAYNLWKESKKNLYLESLKSITPQFDYSDPIFVGVSITGGVLLLLLILLLILYIRLRSKSREDA